jgi:hypothetical protein
VVPVPVKGSVTQLSSVVCAVTAENVMRSAVASLNGLSVILTESAPLPAGPVGAGGAGVTTGAAEGAAGDFGASVPPPQATIRATKTAGNATSRQRDMKRVRMCVSFLERRRAARSGTGS